MHPFLRPILVLCTSLSLGLSQASEPQAQPVTLTVICSKGFIGALHAISPSYEKSSAVTLNIRTVSSRRQTLEAIADGRANGQQVDLVLTDGAAMDTLVAQRQVDKATRVDLGQSFIAVAVRQGAEKPNIETVSALRDALIRADSVAYSNTGSGAYLSRWLFPHMALDQDFLLKSNAVHAEPVASVVARGEAQLGFQQLSELKAAPGIDIVGLITDKVQQMVLYSGAVAQGSAYAAQARDLLKYLKSPDGSVALQLSGLRPLD